MDKRKTLSTALGGVLIGGMLLSGGMAFAGDADSLISDTVTNNNPFFGQAVKYRGSMGKGAHFKFGMGLLSQETLDQLVKEEVITKEKADEIKAYIGKMAEERQTGSKPRLAIKQNLFTGLVDDKILTQEQADTIQTKIKEAVQKQNQQRISDGLKALVEKGTITEEQSGKILNKLEEVHKDREALLEKIKDMTPEERRQYMQDNKGKAQSPINQLVTDGTITQDQADAVGKILIHQKGFQGGHKGFKGGRF